MKEIAWKSLEIYKKNFLKLLVPFLVLATVASLALGLGGGEIVAEYHQGETIVLAGDNLKTPSWCRDLEVFSRAF